MRLQFMRRHQFMSRHLAERLVTLAAAGVIVSLASCAGQPHQSGNAAVATSLRDSAPSASAASAPESTPDSPPPVGPALASSYLVDLTWLSGERGWALVAAPCSSGMCSRVAATRNGGRSWTPLSVPAGLGRNWQISQIRFATAKFGYLFGPTLYQTRDGGHSWRRVRSRPVEALQPAGGTVLRLVYDHSGCPGPCNRTLQEAVAGSDAWRTLLRIPLARANGDITAQIIRPGTRVIYVPVYGNLAGGQGGIKAVIFRSTNAGRSWQRLPDPCGGSGRNTHAVATMSAGARGYLAVLCDSLSGPGRTFIRTSEDYGSSWGLPRMVPSGLQLLATPRPGRLVLATGGVSGSGPFAYRLDFSGDDGLHWTTIVTGTTQLGPQAAAPAILAFAGSRSGWWASDSQDVWITSDGGLDWRRRPFA